MKYRLTILNSASFLFLIACIVYTIWKYKILSEAEGWGVVYMVGIFAFGATALLVDAALQKFIKRKDYQNTAGIIALLIYIVLFFYGN